MTDADNDYGVFGDEIEADSDVNEDRGREMLLDDSFEAWYENIEEQVQRKQDITNVPKDNVFEAAIDLEENPSKD